MISWEYCDIFLHFFNLYLLSVPKRAPKTIHINFKNSSQRKKLTKPWSGFLCTSNYVSRHLVWKPSVALKYSFRLEASFYVCEFSISSSRQSRLIFALTFICHILHFSVPISGTRSRSLFRNTFFLFTSWPSWATLRRTGSGNPSSASCPRWRGRSGIRTAAGHPRRRPRPPGRWWRASGGRRRCSSCCGSTDCPSSSRCLRTSSKSFQSPRKIESRIILCV